MPSRNHTPKRLNFRGGGCQSDRSPSPRPIFTRNLGIIHWKRAFRRIPSTGGGVFSPYREISTVEGGDEHESSPNRCPCPASSSRCDHGSGQQKEIIRVIPEGEWFGFRRRCPGHFSLAGGAWEGCFLPWADCGAMKSGESARIPLPIRCQLYRDLSAFMGFYRGV